MQITINWQTFIGIAGGVAAVIALLGYLFKGYDFVRRQKEQDKDIKSIKVENSLVIYSLRACLDGLQQLGANHTVPEAKEKLDKFINKQAHGIE